MKDLFKSTLFCLLLMGSTALQAQTDTVGNATPAPITDQLVNDKDGDSSNVIIRRYHRRYCTSGVARTTLVIGWGCNNWCSHPFDLFNRTTGDYGITTSFRSFHVAYNWNFLRTKNWTLGAGLEYEHAAYRFGNPYVQWEQGTEHNTFRAVDVWNEIGDCETRLRTDYIGVPVSCRWTPDGHFFLGLTAFVGLDISTGSNGLYYYYKSDSHKGTSRQSTPGLMAPVKADLRFTVGFEGLMLYFQSTLTNIIRNMEQPAYPAQIGFLIEL